MKISRKQIIKYAILIVILFATIYFLTFPYFTGIRQIYINLTKEAVALEEKFISGQDLAKSSSDFESYNDKIPEYDELFIKEGNELSLVTNLEEIANKYNVNQELSLGIDKTQISEEVKRVPFNFVIKGNFNSILKYFSEIFKMSYNLTIHNLNIKQIEDGDLEARLLGYTYWLSN